MPERDPAKRSAAGYAAGYAADYAEVYDVLYGAPPLADDPFLDAQRAFLLPLCGEPPATILDAGCGTGRHVLPLAERGYRVAGLDMSRAMLAQARSKSTVPPGLVQGNLLALPFPAASFDAALCLESPLAYLQTEPELRAALDSLRRVLTPGARLIVDVFDYPGTLGTAPILPHRRVFDAPWGTVEVTESHRYDRGAGSGTCGRNSRRGVGRGASTSWSSTGCASAARTITRPALRRRILPSRSC